MRPWRTAKHRSQQRNTDVSPACIQAVWPRSKAYRMQRPRLADCVGARRVRPNHGTANSTHPDTVQSHHSRARRSQVTSLP